MWEIVFGLLPLIFLCSAAGLIFLNLDAIFEYIVSMVIGLKQTFSPQASNYSNVPIIPHTTPTRPSSGNIIKEAILGFFRILKAIFLPDIDLRAIYARPAKELSEPSYISQKAEKFSESINIKSYSSVGKEDVNYQLSYVPQHKINHNIPKQIQETDISKLREENLEAIKQDAQDTTFLSKSIPTAVTASTTSNPFSTISSYKKASLTDTTSENFHIQIEELPKPTLNVTPIESQNPSPLPSPLLSSSNQIMPIKTPIVTQPVSPEKLNARSQQFDAIETLSSDRSSKSSIQGRNENKINIDLNNLQSNIEKQKLPPLQTTSTASAHSDQVIIPDPMLNSMSQVGSLGNILKKIFLYGLVFLPVVILTLTILLYINDMNNDKFDSGYFTWVRAKIENLVTAQFNNR